MFILQIDSLKAKLDVLKSTDIDFQVFGAGKHRYKSTPVSVSELRELESGLGVTLPCDYRQWLVEVGVGAGPYYGLLSSSQILLENEDLQEDFQTNGTELPADIEAIDYLSDAHLAAYADRAQKLGSQQDFAITMECARGIARISHMGCDGYCCLVLTGEHSGKVVYETRTLSPNDSSAATAIWPTGIAEFFYDNGDTRLRVDKGSFFSFFCWMNHWIDNSFVRLRESPLGRSKESSLKSL